MQTYGVNGNLGNFVNFSSIIIIVVPEIPQFFWVCAYAHDTLVQSIDLVKKFDEQSFNKNWS